MRRQPFLLTTGAMGTLPAREMRHGQNDLGPVLWRKRSFGTQSERGNRFAERLMTVAHTARKQGNNVLELLTQCCVAQRDGGTYPSLFADSPAA